MSPVLLVTLLMVPLITSCTSQDNYLDREQVELPVNGTVITTTKALAPYTLYTIRFSSPHDLARTFRYTESLGFLRGSVTLWRFDFDGAERLAGYEEDGPGWLINHVLFKARGTGQQLKISTGKDLTASFAAPTLSVLVLRSRWWRTDDGTSIYPFIYAVLGLVGFLFVCALFSSRDAPATYSTAVVKPKPPSVPIQPRALAAPPLHQRFKLTPHKHCTSSDPVPKDTDVVVAIEGLWTVSATTIYDMNPDPTLYGIDAQYVGPCTKPVGAWQRHGRLFFDDAHEPAAAFRLDPHHHRFSFAYIGTGDKLVLFLEIPPVCAGHTFWHKDTMSVTIHEMTSADRADIPPALPPPESPSADDKMRQAYLNRMRALEIEFGGRRHLDDEDWIERYTKKHLHNLLKDRTRIMAAHAELHHDPAFVSLFTETEPALYHRVTWEHRALCRAEELEVGSPGHSKLTPEERAERIRGFRERAVERERVRIDDETSMLSVAFESVEELLDARNTKIAEIRARTDLDSTEQEERIRAIKAITDHRLAQFSEEQQDGGTHDSTWTRAGTPPAAADQEPVILDE